MLTKLRKWFNVGALSNNQLKMIALVCMTIDHIGAYILTDCIILRIIGRISFPIFAYMIAEGCTYTKNRKKYLGIMAITAFLYQTAYFVITGSLAQFILVTFTLSILLIYVTDYAKINRQLFLLTTGLWGFLFLSLCMWLRLGETSCLCFRSHCLCLREFRAESSGFRCSQFRLLQYIMNAVVNTG